MIPQDVTSLEKPPTLKKTKTKNINPPKQKIALPKKSKPPEDLISRLSELPSAMGTARGAASRAGRVGLRDARRAWLDMCNAFGFGWTCGVKHCQPCYICLFDMSFLKDSGD